MAPLLCDNVEVMNYSMGMQAKHRVDLVRWKLPRQLGMSFNDRLPYPINYVPAQEASGSIKLYTGPPQARRPPLYGVGTYDTGFHDKLSWSMSVKRLLPIM